MGAFSVIVKTDGSFAALVVSRPSNVKGHTTQREEKHGTINCLWDLLSPICHHQQWGGRTGRGAPPKLGFLWGWDKLYWVYVYVVRRWMLGFYIPLFYGDCTTQSLRYRVASVSRYTSAILSPPIFTSNSLKCCLSTIDFWGMTKKIGDKELFLDSILCSQGMIS